MAGNVCNNCNDNEKPSMARRYLYWKMIGNKQGMVIWELGKIEVSCSPWTTSQAKQRLSVRKVNISREGHCLAYHKRPI